MSGLKPRARSLHRRRKLGREWAAVARRAMALLEAGAWSTAAYPMPPTRWMGLNRRRRKDLKLYGRQYTVVTLAA